jgi:hypothetical protein
VPVPPAEGAEPTNETRKLALAEIRE